MNAAEVIRLKSWNAEASNKVSAAQMKQKNAEETLAEYVPNQIMQAVHLLLCLQGLNDRELILGITPYEENMRRKVIADMSLALEALEPLGEQRGRLEKMLDQNTAKWARARKSKG